MNALEIDNDQLSSMLRALAHPVRLEILRSLGDGGDQQCMDLTREVALAQSTVSEHLKVLKDAGLIQQCGPGPRSGYCLNKDALLWLKQSIIGL